MAEATPDRDLHVEDEAATTSVPPAMRLQVLSTEHWSLLASRSLAWNEAFSRAGMFLSTLSAATVALGLMAQASTFGSLFVLSALVMLPIVLFIGVVTFLRLGAVNYHDAQCIIGMNRIRSAYLKMAPDLAPYFVMGTSDDVRGVQLTMALPPGMGTLAHLLAATPTLVSVLNAVLVGVIAALLSSLVPLPTGVALALGVASFLVSLVLHAWYGRRTMLQQMQRQRPLFPTPEGR